MISSIFGKTKPIVYLILLGFLFLFYWGSHYFLFDREYLLPEISFRMLVIFVLMFSVFIVNFIVSRNQVTGTHSYAMLYFTLLIVVFPETLVDPNAIFCSFFLLLATRRLISMRSEREMKAKIFDAALWIGVASLFYDWSILYLIVLYVAIYFYDPKDLKNWFLPLSGLFAVALVKLAVEMSQDGTATLFSSFDFQVNIHRTFTAMWEHHTKLLSYAALVVIVGFLTFIRLGALGLGRIITMRLIAIAATLGLIISILETDLMHFPVLITFFPASAIFAKYVETIRKRNFRELTLIASVLVPFLWLLLQSVIK